MKNLCLITLQLFLFSFTAFTENAVNPVKEFYEWLFLGEHYEKELQEFAEIEEGFDIRISSSIYKGNLIGFINDNKNLFIPENAIDSRSIVISDTFGITRENKIIDKSYVLTFFPEKMGRSELLKEVLFPINRKNGKIIINNIRIGGMDGHLLEEYLK